MLTMLAQPITVHSSSSHNNSTVSIYALNFRRAQFSRTWENCEIYAPRTFSQNCCKLLLVALGGLCQAFCLMRIPSSSISTANSDVPKVLELKERAIPEIVKKLFREIV